MTPFALGVPSDAFDWTAWTVLRDVYEQALVGGTGSVKTLECELWGRRFHLLVCNSCTAVYRPKSRVNQSSKCSLCEKRSAAPALNDLSTRAALDAGEPVVIRVPIPAGREFVSAWGTRTVCPCVECGELIYAKQGARICSKKCESRQARRLRDETASARQSRASPYPVPASRTVPERPIEPMNAR